MMSPTKRGGRAGRVDEPTSKMTQLVLTWSSIGKRVVAGILMVLTFMLVAAVTFDIAVSFFRALLPGRTFAPAALVVSESQMLEVLGLFLSVLIALELIETVEVYFRHHAIHVEIVVLVAIIALARKVILLDLGRYSPLTLLALASLIMALGATYFLVRKAAPRDE
jgi:uncharacterized membrane protein (DUF373 family)